MIHGGTAWIEPTDSMVVEDGELFALTADDLEALDRLVPDTLDPGAQVMRETGFRERIHFRRRPYVPCITDVQPADSGPAGS